MEERQQVSKYLGYSGGKGYLWIAVILVLMFTFIGLYFTKYHMPDYANWNVENPDADKIIWEVEKKINPNMSE